MRSEYLDYVRSDTKLYAAVQPALQGLEALSAQQVETLIFYLKSLHAYYPASANDVENYQRFSQQLDRIRNTDSQQKSQQKAATLLNRAMIASGIAGISAALGAVMMVVGQGVFGGGLIVGALGLFLFAESRFGRPALVTAKEQDRRYFLECLRAARACNELDWAGLFTYGDQSVEDMADQLRNALYNDEYMQYSHARQQEHGREALTA